MRCKIEGEITLAGLKCVGISHLEGSRSLAGTLSESDVLRIAAQAVQLYAERHPRPPHVNMTQAAKMLGLSQPTVRNLMHSGKLRYDGCGLIPIEQIDKLLAAGR